MNDKNHMTRNDDKMIKGRQYLSPKWNPLLISPSAGGQKKKEKQEKRRNKLNQKQKQDRHLPLLIHCRCVKDDNILKKAVQIIFLHFSTKIAIYVGSSRKIIKSVMHIAVFLQKVLGCLCF